MAGAKRSYVGYDPPTAKLNNLQPDKISPEEYDVVEENFKRLIEAIESKELEAVVRYPYRASKGFEASESEYSVPTLGWYHVDIDCPDKLPRQSSEPSELGAYHIMCSEIRDWDKSTVQKDHLVEWLERINHHDQFFNPVKNEDDPCWDVLDPEGEAYSSRLAAAIKAWREVSNPTSSYFWGKHATPKQALIKYIEENAKDLLLADKHGTQPKVDAVGTIAAVANWDERPGRRKEKTEP
jgi:hypothetical protein